MEQTVINKGKWESYEQETIDYELILKFRKLKKKNGHTNRYLHKKFDIPTYVQTQMAKAYQNKTGISTRIKNKKRLIDYVNYDFDKDPSARKFKLYKPENLEDLEEEQEEGDELERVIYQAGMDLSRYNGLCLLRIPVDIRNEFLNVKKINYHTKEFITDKFLIGRTTIKNIEQNLEPIMTVKILKKVLLYINYDFDKDPDAKDLNAKLWKVLLTESGLNKKIRVGFKYEIKKKNILTQKIETNIYNIVADYGVNYVGEDEEGYTAFINKEKTKNGKIKFKVVLE